jgi:hypothetical protein
MAPASVRPARPISLSRAVPGPGLTLGLLLVLLPYLFAGLTGSPAEQTAGLARFHSAAESVYCRAVFSLFAALLLVKLGLVGAGLAAAAGRRLGRLGLAVGSNGWLLLTVPHPAGVARHRSYSGRH